MKLAPWFLAAFAPIAVAGCSGTMLGHLAVLAVTVGIFVGTLSLGRHTGANAVNASQTVSEPALLPAAAVAPVQGAALAAEVTTDTI